MELNQLEKLDKATLISMVTELSQKTIAWRGRLWISQSRTRLSDSVKNETRILFSNFAQKWLILNKGKWQRTTYEEYWINVCKHIVPYFLTRSCCSPI